MNGNFWLRLGLLIIAFLLTFFFRHENKRKEKKTIHLSE